MMQIDSRGGARWWIARDAAFDQSVGGKEHPIVSLAMAFKGSEGIVLAADSRVTITLQMSIPVPGGTAIPMALNSTYDNATKLLKVSGQEHVAAVTFGVGTIGFPEPRTAHSFLPEFEATIAPTQRLSVEEFAKQLGDFFLAQWNKTMPAGATGPMVFIVGGYDENTAYGRIFEIQIPNTPAPVERHANSFGLQWGGQQEIMSRVLNGYDPSMIELIKNKYGLNDTQLTGLITDIQNASGAKIPYQFLPLQDCVDLCILMIRTTSQLLDYQTSIRGVGGAIDVATITRQDGFHYVQRKKIRGERERI
jgi:hypothetical protein